MITVLIPTAKRPEFLAKTLRSVSEQTALGEIAEVIVSENGGDNRSAEVCRQFPQLPIHYLLRQPPTKATEHYASLCRRDWSGELIALLHDDDWWAPEHLACGLEALARHPQAAAYCSGRYWVQSEASLLFCDSGLAAWFGADYPDLQAEWELSRDDMLLTSLVDTPAHYSTLLMKRSALREAAVVYDTGNPYDNDRMLIFELAKYGTILYSPMARAFVRLHAHQITQNFAFSERDESMVSTTRWVVQTSGMNWQEAAQLFVERMRNCPDIARATVYAEMMKPWRLPLLAQNCGEDSDAARLCRSLSPKNSFFQRCARQLVPPAFFSLKKRLQRA